MDSIQQELRIVKLKKLKKKIQKAFPKATIVVDASSNYYVSDGEGKRLIPNYLMIPNSKSVYDAWVHAEMGLWYHHLMERNRLRFSDEKVMKKRL
jgi:hypothetical protein|tara:strand:+ start:59 stop:343 length:285 start_codon:yes stop_codon:yes gene_type:complete